MSTQGARYYEVLRIFIGCPGDLTEERSRFPRILETVNRLRAHALGFHLEPVGWERVVPSTGRPQELINQELRSADLILILFWNSVGSPSGKDDLTGTLEELEIAKQMCRFGEEPDWRYPIQHPSLYVYFRSQDQPDTDSARRISHLRHALEHSKRLLYRMYSDVAEWESLLMEHLVAFLNGRRRKELEVAVQSLPPEAQIMRGRFLWQASYGESGIITVTVDFDGDDRDETVTFRFQQTQHWLTFSKDGIGYEISPSDGFTEYLQGARAIHLAVKDVTNDGIPELLIAVDAGDANLQLAILGMREGRFAELAVLDGQFNVYVYEGGHLIMPYGSVGLYIDYRWNADKKGFDKQDLYDPLRTRPAF